MLCVSRVFVVVARRACNMQMELSNDCLPETEYQGVLAHPHTAVLDSGAIGHTTLLPYTSDVTNSSDFLHQSVGDWCQLPYASCHGAVCGSPDRSPAISCARGRYAAGGGAHAVCGPAPPPPLSSASASPGPGAASSDAAVVQTPTIKTGGRYARQNSLTSSFSNLI